MKKMLLQFCLFIANFQHLSLARPVEEVEGIERGNGGDSYDEQSNIAWFVDNKKPIKYCANVENKSIGFSNQKSFKVHTGVHDSQGRPIDIYNAANDIESTVQYGVATLANQETIQLVMYKNFNDSKYTIDVISGMNSFPIFISTKPGE